MITISRNRMTVIISIKNYTRVHCCPVLLSPQVKWLSAMKNLRSAALTITMTKWQLDILRIYNLISRLTCMTQSLGPRLHPVRPLSLGEIREMSARDILCQITHGASFLEFLIICFFRSHMRMTLDLISNKALRWHAELLRIKMWIN